MKRGEGIFRHLGIPSYVLLKIIEDYELNVSFEMISEGEYRLFGDPFDVETLLAQVKVIPLFFLTSDQVKVRLQRLGFLSQCQVIDNGMFILVKSQNGFPEEISRELRIFDYAAST